MKSKLRILLADDSRFFRAIESQFLQKIPVEILEASNCAEVLTTIRKEKPDMVYMAYSLPTDGGAVCCQKIKADPEFRSLPVVIICDQGDLEQSEIARRTGCDAILVKPLDRHNFLQVGRRFLDGIREHRQPSYFPVTLSTGGIDYVGKCLDISSGGIFVESKADIQSGTPIDLTFTLPDDVATQITCNGVVSWLNRKPGPIKPHYPHGFGIKFVKLPTSIHTGILNLSDKKTSN
jgi:CheY-like chemotaxis protein/Tfp pilus assembly protein PilZ